MKKSVVSLLALMCLALVGCNDKTSDATSTLSSDTPSKDTSTTEVKTVTTEEKIIDALSSGFRSNEVLTVSELWTGDEEPTVSYYSFDLGVNSDYYQYRQYSAEKQKDGSIVSGSLEYTGTFTHLTGTDGGDNVNLVELGLDNVVEYTELLDDEEDSPYLWSDYGFENAFLELGTSSLVKESDTVYSVDLDTVGDTFLHNLSCQVYGMDFGTINEFKITVDSNGTPVGYSGKYDTVTGTIFSYTYTTDVSFDATITYTGADSIMGVTPLTGTADADLAAALTSLQAKNYDYSFTKYAGNYPDDGNYNLYSTAKASANANSITLTSYYKNGSVNFDGGYYTENGKTQEVAKIGNDYYKNGDVQDYTIGDDVLPAFNISPLFFDKTSDGVYVLNDEKYYTGGDETNVYSFMNYSAINNLTITLGDDGSVTFENVIPAGAHTTSYKYVEKYYNIGGVSDTLIDTTAVKATLGDLTWSDIFAGASDLDDIYTFMGGKDNLDAVPTTQDNHSAYSYYFDADEESFQIQYSATSSDEVTSMIATYDTVMKAAGFSDPTIDEKYGDHTYTKTVTGGTITVVAADYSDYSGYFFVIMPTFEAAE